jgi:hypothetical protein
MLQPRMFVACDHHACKSCNGQHHRRAVQARAAPQAAATQVKAAERVQLGDSDLQVSGEKAKGSPCAGLFFYKWHSSWQIIITLGSSDSLSLGAVCRANCPPMCAACRLHLPVVCCLGTMTWGQQNTEVGQPELQHTCWWLSRVSLVQDPSEYPSRCVEYKHTCIQRKCTLKTSVLPASSVQQHRRCKSTGLSMQQVQTVVRCIRFSLNGFCIGWHRLL